MKRTILANALLYASLLIGCGAVQSQSSPPLEQMKLAERSSKVSVPVDVRYQFRAAATRDQPVGLDLAFVSRVPGRNLTVEFPRPESATIDSGGVSFAQQKAQPQDVMRRSLVVTPREDHGVVRVLVSLDVEGARYFGVFSIPIRLDR
jgi:hypothetical protein